MIIFDTEDDSRDCLESGRSGFDKKVTQIAAITTTGKRFHNSGNVKEFLKWVHRQKSCDVWAFNAQYDIGNLVNAPEYKLPDFDYTLVKGRFIKGQCEGLKFFDVHNLSGGGSSVATLGLSVGLPKFGHAYTEKELASFSADRQKEFLEFLGLSRQEYIAALKLSPVRRRRLFEKNQGDIFGNKKYIFRDCEIPLRWLSFVKSQCDEFGIENVPATLGGLCVKVFSALGNENWFCDDEQAKTALIGARVELFSAGGKGNLAYTDINSLYPSAMMEIYPDCFSDMGKSLTGYGIAEVKIKVPKTHLTPLPVKDKEGRLIFPYGILRGVWTFHEIHNAVKHGSKILKVYWSKGSETGKAYYAEYVSEIYKRRLAAKNKSENLFFKLLMNNLYGRLAIGGEISRTLNLCDENKDNGIPFGRKILADVKMPLPGFTNYLHAAYVLSYARIKLYSYLKKIPRDDLVYCDTDSAIFFNRGDKLPFPVSNNLGEMKLEKFGKSCFTYAPKSYSFDGEYKAKGVPKRLAKTFIDTGSAEFDLPFKLRESIVFFDRTFNPVCPVCESSNVNVDDKGETYNNYCGDCETVWDGRKIKLSVWRKVKKINETVYDRKEIFGNYYLPKRVKMM